MIRWKHLKSQMVIIKSRIKRTILKKKRSKKLSRSKKKELRKR
jgi:hypothetical protein